jgi:hypothetical protein
MRQSFQLALNFNHSQLNNTPASEIPSEIPIDKISLQLLSPITSIYTGQILIYINGGLVGLAPPFVTYLSNWQATRASKIFMKLVAWKTKSFLIP